MNSRKLLGVSILFIFIIIILFIVIIFMVPVTNQMSPMPDSFSVIRYSVPSTRVGEIRPTPIFFVRAEEIFSVDNLKDVGIDKKTICFDSGRLPEDIIKISDDCRFFTNQRNTLINLRAEIFCESNPEKLENLIIDSNTELAGKTPTEVWSSEESYSNYNKICFVVLNRA